VAAVHRRDVGATDVVGQALLCRPPLMQASLFAAFGRRLPLIRFDRGEVSESVGHCVVSTLPARAYTVTARVPCVSRAKTPPYWIDSLIVALFLQAHIVFDSLG
jgi:hypothetical protein